MLEKINFAKLFNLNLIKTNKFSVTNIIFLQLKLNNVNFTFLFTTVKNHFTSLQKNLYFGIITVHNN